jgi:hypothetical protein
MTDGDRQAQPIRPFRLKRLFQDAASGAIGSAASGFNEQLADAGKALGEFGRTPVQQLIDGNGRGVRRLSNLHRAPLRLKVVNAIRNGPSQPLAGKGMELHRCRLLTPDPSGLLEVPDQLLLLGIDADAGMSRWLRRRARFPDIVEWLIRLGMGRAFALLDIQP